VCMCSAPEPNGIQVHANVLSRELGNYESRELGNVQYRQDIDKCTYWWSHHPLKYNPLVVVLTTPYYRTTYAILEGVVL
jgi:hypothetical protein